MKIFKFYNVNQEYINYLKKYENRIPNISYEKNDKFLCGILFSINGNDYYAPISSFNKQQKSNILIKNTQGKILSSIRLSFMFPVPKEVLKIKDISKENYSYQRLLQEELMFCNKNAEKIVNKAKHIYKTVVDKTDDLMQKNCCNFLLLEKKYLEYCKLHNLEHSPKLKSEPLISDKTTTDNLYFMEVKVADLQKLDGLSFEKRIDPQNPESAIIAIDKQDIDTFKNALKPRGNDNGLKR